MKKIFFILFTLLTVVFINCVAFNKVIAQEDTWYTEAANNAGNPILLEDDQYFQGVSINSHLISDLTFMEIDFNKYISGELKEVQIITFSKALYVSNNSVLDEVVMYVYYPDKYNGDNKTIVTDIDFESQKCLIGSGFVDCLSSVDQSSVYSGTWSKISSYENITKYSFCKLQVKFAKRNLTEWLLKKYIDGQDFTELQTIFKANIKKFKVTKNNKTTTYTNDGSEDFCKNQEFQFIIGLSLPVAMYELNPLSANNDTGLLHDVMCVNKNENTVKVEGETACYRYAIDNDITAYFPWLVEGHNTKLIDLNYFFFNVFEDGSEWGEEKNIKEVKLNYILGYAFVQIGDRTAINFDKTWDCGFYFLDSKGMPIGTEYDGTIIPDWYASPRDGFSSENEAVSYMSEEFITHINRTELFHESIVVPETYTFNYLTGSYNDAWEVYKKGYYNTEDTTYLTLFNTESEEFKKIASKTNNYNSKLTEKYQFGLIYGDPQGYPVNIVEKEELSGQLGGIGMYHEKTTTFYMSAISSLTEITYEEKGTIYKVSVTENQIDNSQANIPQNPEDDPWESIPGDPKPVDDDDNFWAWLLKIIRFFTEDIPNWFKKNKTAIVGFGIAVVVIIAAIFLWRLLSPIITAVVTKKAVEQASKKKEE